MTHKSLDNLWTRTHSRLLLLANGSTANYDPKTSGATNNRAGPPNLHQDISELEEDWAKAYSKKAKRRVLWAALETLFYYSPRARQKAALPYMPNNVQDQLRKAAVGHKLMQQRSERTKEWRMAVAREEGTLEQVSALYGVPERTIRRWRAEFPKRNGGMKHTQVSRTTYDFIQRNIRLADVLGDPDSV